MSRPKNPDGTTPRPWQTMNNGRSPLWHIETAAENEAGAGIPIVSLPKALEADAELIVNAVNAHDHLLDELDDSTTLLNALLGAMPPALQKKWPSIVARAVARIDSSRAAIKRMKPTAAPTGERP